MKLYRRNRVFVDARIQGAMLGRVVVYWLFGLAMVMVLMTWESVIRNPGTPLVEHFRFDNFWGDRSVVLLTAFIMLPVILVDVTIMSNRLVGPFWRIRRAMRVIASGSSIEPIQFRRGDYWRDVADDINLLNESFEQLKKQVASSVHEHEPAAVH